MKLSALFLLLLAQAVAPPQFKSGVNFVEVDVVVADRTGVPVRGLRREDFEVTEDGKPVELLTFSAVDVPAAEPAAVIPPLDRSGTSVAANDQPQDGRVLLIVLDDYHVSFDAGRAATSRAIANKLVERMGPSDLVAVMSTSGQRSTQAEFTSDKAKLLEAIKAFFPQSETGADGIAASGLPRRGGGGGGMGFVGGIKARWAMDTLRSAATGLALIPHRRKAVLLVTQGLPVSVEDIITNSNASDAFQALRDFILTAQRSNIAIYTMDPCGLDLDAGCSTSSRQNLQTLAEATGGFSVTNTNAPEASVDRMIAETGTYYLIGYSSPAPPYDGKRHRIKVRTREPGHQVRARESYISPRRAPQAKAAPSAIDALVEAPIQSRGLTMRIAAVPAPLATKPGATVAVGIELLAADAARAGSIDFTLVAVDSNGKVSTPAAIPEHFPGEGSTARRMDPSRVARRRASGPIPNPPGGGRREWHWRQRLHRSDRAEIHERPGDRRALARVAGVAHRAAGRVHRERPAAGAAADPGVPGGDPARRTTADSRHGEWRRGDHHRNAAVAERPGPDGVTGASGRAGGVHRAGRRGLSGAAAAEPGCWRLSPDRRRRVRHADRATREVSFRVLPKP